MEDSSPVGATVNPPYRRPFGALDSMGWPSLGLSPQATCRRPYRGYLLRPPARVCHRPNPGEVFPDPLPQAKGPGTAGCRVLRFPPGDAAVLEVGRLQARGE